MAGDARGRVFTFPIPTYNMTPDFPWESENATLLFEMTAKYGLPYFQNFLNSDMKPNHVRSMCCRLQLDLRELLKRGLAADGFLEAPAGAKSSEYGLDGQSPSDGYDKPPGEKSG